MDSTREFTTLEWCAGYCGISKGLRRAIPYLRTIAYSEIEAFAVANLVAKMEAGLLDAAPIWPDLKTFPCREFHGKVDLLIAGYPCQPFSSAGRRQGAEDPRHLWPYIREAVRVVRPRYCFFENVEGHISLGLSTVISDLEEDGYAATWGIFSAEEVGAPHRRKRVFILGHRQHDGLHGLPNARGGNQAGDRGTERPVATFEFAGTGRPTDNGNIQASEELADNKRERSEKQYRKKPSQAQQYPAGNTRGDVWPSRPGEEQHRWEPPRVVANHRGEEHQRVSQAEGRKQNIEAGKPSRSGQVKPPLDRNSDGTTDRLDNAELYQSCDNRTDELRLLGNGVVPATATLAWMTLYNRLRGETPTH